MRMGTAAQAAANNFVLAKGEFGYTTDDHVLKVGDGVTAWNSLVAPAGSGGVTQEQIEDFVGAMVTGNTETGITVTYNDGTGKLDFVTAVTTAYTDEMAQDAVGGMLTGNTETRIALTYDDAGAKINAVVDAFPVLIPFSIAGALTVADGTRAIPNPSGRSILLKQISFTVETVNTGSAVTLDARNAGTTIYTTSGNRPTKAAGGTASTVSTAGNSDAAASVWAAGAVLLIDVKAIGSTIAGSDLTGMIYGEI